MAHAFDSSSDQPWGRGNASAIPCPFCGSSAVKQSFGDDPSDPVRLELYCDNGMCEAREFVILARRLDYPHARADLAALEAVDDYGARETIEAGTPLSELEAERDARWERRKRPARITVEPADG